MKLECVIVCINYSDFLSHTLPYNKSQFDRIVVVTDEKDSKTKTLCEFWNVQCICTNDVYENGSEIPNKGIAINKGLEVLDKDGWVLHVDADIFLLPLTRSILNRYHLDPDCIYGTDRLMCESYTDWHNFIHNSNKSIHEGWIYVHVDRFKIGTRLVHYHNDGYWPIGFFQLWNPSHSSIFQYPTEKAGYDRTDVTHLKKWPSYKRRLIPDFVVVHLSNESHKQGQNWHGRKTALFAPTFKERFNIFEFLKGILIAIKQGLDKIRSLFKCKIYYYKNSK